MNNIEKKSKFFLPFIIILTSIVFSNTLANDFIENWDDKAYILDNELLRNLSWQNLKIIFSSFYLGNYHPLTLLSYTIEFKFFGLNPFYYHLDNLMLHLINVALVFFFMKRFTGKLWVAAITSLFFALHPMHVESVAWISERKDLLYTLFFLLSLNSYSKYLQDEKKTFYILSTFLWFCFSLFSKPAAVCLPLVLVLMDFYSLKKIKWNAILWKIPFFAMALLFGIIAIQAQKSSEAISDLAISFGILDRFFLVLYSFVFYIFKLFMPFSLASLHYYPVKFTGFLPLEFYLALPAILALVWIVFKSGGFKRDLLFGLLFYFITIVLVLQIIPVGKAIVSERYSYVPYIGIFFIIGQFFSYIKERKAALYNNIRSVFPFLLLSLTILFSILTYQRNKVWKNGEVLFSDVIRKYPEQSYGWWARGNSKMEKKNYQGALLDFDKSIMLGSMDASLYTNRGIAKVNLNKFEEAFVDYNKAIDLNSTYVEAYFNRGTLYTITQKYDMAIADYNIAIKLKPQYAEAFSNRGASYAYQNKMDESLKDFNTAIKLNPLSAEAYFSRGFTKLSLNDKVGACQDWHTAQKIGYIKAADILNTYCQ